MTRHGGGIERKLEELLVIVGKREKLKRSINLQGCGREGHG